MHAQKKLSSFHLLRYFSLTSLLSILIVALVIIFFFRFMVVSAVSGLGAELNTSIARSALTTTGEDLERFIQRHNRSPLDGESNMVQADSAPIQAIENLVGGSGIVRVKVYGRDGTVIYSTKPEQIGRNQADNPGFLGAMKGEPSSKLVYHDHLNPFDDEISDENLIQTYLPVIGETSQRPIGVFEIYSDANGIVGTAEKAQLIVVPVVLGTLLALYLFLLTIVRKANATIERQKNIISERTHTLEFLSSKLLLAQEDERKRLAQGLHESVAQSLLAIKLGLENQSRHEDSAPPGALLALIQDTIEQTREFAIELRPSALDDFGVVEALNTLLGELDRTQDDLRLRWEFKIDESDIPKPLKTIIFRIVQDTLRGLTRETEADRIQVSLSRKGKRIQLDIVENSYAYRNAGERGTPDGGTTAALALMRERTAISGGDFEAIANSDGTILNTASWPI